MDSTDFEWHDSPEWYNILGRMYDVNAARKIIREKPRAVVPLDISGISCAVHAIKEETKVDLLFPLILISLEETHWPIDGWNRIDQAKKKSIVTLPCVILDLQETKKIWIR